MSLVLRSPYFNKGPAAEKQQFSIFINVLDLFCELEIPVFTLKITPESMFYQTANVSKETGQF